MLHNMPSRLCGGVGPSVCLLLQSGHLQHHAFSASKSPCTQPDGAAVKPVSNDKRCKHYTVNPLHTDRTCSYKNTCSFGAKCRPMPLYTHTRSSRDCVGVQFATLQVQALVVFRNSSKHIRADRGMRRSVYPENGVRPKLSCITRARATFLRRTRFIVVCPNM